MEWTDDYSSDDDMVELQPHPTNPNIRLAPVTRRAAEPTGESDTSATEKPRAPPTPSRSNTRETAKRALPDFLSSRAPVQTSTQPNTKRRRTHQLDNPNVKGRPNGKERPGTTRLSRVPGSASVSSSAPRIGANPDAVVQRTVPINLREAEAFVNHLREEGRLVYLFAEELASMLYNFDVRNVLNIRLSEIDPVEFAKSYPWVFYTINQARQQNAGVSNGLRFENILPRTGRQSAGAVAGYKGVSRDGTRFRIDLDDDDTGSGEMQESGGGAQGAQEVQNARDTHHTEDAEDMETALHIQQRDVYNIGQHVRQITHDYIAHKLGYTSGALVGARRRYTIAPDPGDGAFSAYNTMLLKPEVMGLVRQALADINNWHHAYRKNQVFSFDDLLSNQTIRSMFARYVAFVRSRSYEVGGSMYSGVTQSGTPFTRSDGKTKFQLQSEYNTSESARRFFLSLRKRANGQVDIGPYRNEDRLMQELYQNERTRPGRVSRFQTQGGYEDASGGVLSLLGGTM